MDRVWRIVERRFVLTVLLLIFFVPFGAMAAVIHGVVSNEETGEPLSGVNVRIDGTYVGAMTDLDGRFTLLRSPAGTVQVIASHVGYARSEKKVLVNGGESVTVALALRPEPMALDEIVYTATKSLQLLKDVPVQTELVSSREIKKNVAQNVAEALDLEVGIDVRDDFAGRGVMLQGVDPDKVLILVDGSRVIGRVNGSIDLQQLTTQGVKQIEVVKGAGSTLYGSEAIGGVINIITEESADPFQLTLDINGGAYLPDNGVEASDRVYSPSVELQYKLGKFDFIAGARYKSNNIMDVDEKTTHTNGVEANDQISTNLKVKYQQTDKRSFILTHRLMNEDKEWIEDTIIPYGAGELRVPYDDRESNTRNDASLEYRYQPSWGERYSVRAYSSSNDHLWEKFTKTGVRQNVSESNEDYQEIAAQFTRNVVSNHRLTSGFEMYWWQIESMSDMGSDEPSVIDADLTAWSAYAQDEFYLMDNLTFVPGIRFEDHERYGNNVSPKVSLMWSILDDLQLRTSLGQGYRAPSSKELYYTFNHSSVGYIVRGNPELEPEKSTSFTFGLEHTYSDRSTSRISYFYNDMENLIDFDSLTVTEDYPMGIYQYENLASAWTQGVELEREMKIVRALRLGIGYSFLETYNNETGERLLRRPIHSSRMVLTWQPDDSWMVRLRAKYTGKMLYQGQADTGSHTSEEWTNNYITLNLNVSKDIGEFTTIYSKVDNVLNTTHSKYGPYRGRVALLGARVTL